MATFTGTSADETITPGFVSPTVTASGGTSPSNAADVIDGGDGNDLIDSGGGNDTVTGGRGNDVALLGSGDDTWSMLTRPGRCGSATVEGQIPHRHAAVQRHPERVGEENRHFGQWLARPAVP